MLHRTRTPSILIALALFAAACSDAPTGPTVVPEAALSSQGVNSSAAGSGASPYACFTSVATPGGAHPWTYGRLDLQFPKTALAPDGATMRYYYRRYSPEGTLLRLASCVIPNTPGAVEAMNRRFGLQGAAMSRRSAGMDEGDGVIGIQACVITYWPDEPYWYLS